MIDAAISGKCRLDCREGSDPDVADGERLCGAGEVVATGLGTEGVEWLIESDRALLLVVGDAASDEAILLFAILLSSRRIPADNALNVIRAQRGMTHNVVQQSGKTAWEAVYPQGSFNPSNTPLGGFGFYLGGSGE